MFSLETIKGKYIQSTFTLSSLTSSGSISDSYFTNYNNISKVIVKLKSTQGSQEILITFSLPQAYDGVADLTSAVYVSPSARDSFELAWILVFDKQGGYYTVKASQLASAADFAVTFTSTEIDPSIPNGQPTIPGQVLVTPGVYENVTVDALGRVVSGSNPSTLVGYGITDAVKNEGGVHSFQSGTNAERLAISSPVEDSIFIALDTSIIYMYNNGAWVALSGDTTAITADIAAETSAREAADTALSSSLDSEVSNRISSLAQETSARQSAISSLQSSIASEAANRSSGDSSTLASAQSYTDGKISDLINAAPAALDTLKEIADQMSSDESAASALVSALATETAARLSGDSAEASDRQAADSNLQMQLNSMTPYLEFTDHTDSNLGVHGVTGHLVGTTDIQVLKGKTINAQENSIDNISNAEISASANIAHSKMAPLTSSKAVVTDGSGVVSSSSVSADELSRLSGVSSNVQTQLDAKASSASLTSHATVSSSVHGVTGSVVGTSDTQTLTNKTIDASSNTVSNLGNSSISTSANIAHSKMETLAASKAVVTNSSGVVEVSSVTSAELGQLSGVSSPVQTQLDAKASSASLTSHASTSSGVHGVTGSVVGTSDAQTLTNKIIDASSNTVSNVANANISASANIAHTKMAALAASKALVSDSSGIVGVSAVTSTELGQLAGVTSAVQTQLDAKAPSTNFIGKAGSAESGTSGFATYTDAVSSKPTDGV